MATLSDTNKVLQDANYKIEHFIELVQTADKKISKNDIDTLLKAIEDSNKALKEFKQPKAKQPSAPIDVKVARKILEALHFIQTSKTTQEKVGAVQVALFGTILSQSLTLSQNLEGIKAALKRGQRVEKVEGDAL